MNAKNKVYVLERLENHGTVEDKDVYRHVDDNTYTIEHIMPQHLTPAWIRGLGEDYEQIHETWLHRMANLTLTAYNSKYSNSSFVEKRDTENGFRMSGLRMNTWIAAQTQWTLKELEERSEILSAESLKIWGMPQTNYQPPIKQQDAYLLDDDTDLSNRVIARFAYQNTEQAVSSWIDMFERVIRLLHNEDRSVLAQIAYLDSAENELRSYISCDPQRFRNPILIDQNIYVERNTSTAAKLSILRKLFKAFGTNPEDLIFFLRDAEEADGTEDTPDAPRARAEWQHRYWEYALPTIRAAHDNGGIFQHVNPSKSNSISSFFGVNGAAISCIANNDCAKVELYLGNSVKEQNKAWFDLLASHKDAIEAALESTTLQWKRLDDAKASVIRIVLPNISIDNEIDWAQMADFHAKWSRKFSDVFVPYLEQRG